MRNCRHCFGDEDFLRPPGYRAYLIQRGKELIVLLCGGDKSTQAADIEEAKALANEFERRAVR